MFLSVFCERAWGGPWVSGRGFSDLLTKKTKKKRNKNFHIDDTYYRTNKNATSNKENFRGFFMGKAWKQRVI